MKIKLAAISIFLATAVAIFAGAYTASNGFVKSLSTTRRISSVIAYNSAGTDRFLLTFDALSLPTNGTVPSFPPVRLPTQTTGSIDFLGTLMPTNGIVVAVSTTDTTLTLTSGNDALILFVYP